MSNAERIAVEVLHTLKDTKSQNHDILTHLFAEGAIDPIEALERYRCYRLSARILDLRRMGVPIDTVMVYRNGKKWATYKLAS